MEGFDSRRLGQLLLILGFVHVPPYPALTRLEAEDIAFDIESHSYH